MLTIRFNLQSLTSKYTEVIGICCRSENFHIQEVSKLMLNL
jgi:S-methylmethionine-dependent homocysteine/selenocysteine methylase